jgi:hypothetical protein
MTKQEFSRRLVHQNWASSDVLRRAAHSDLFISFRPKGENEGFNGWACGSPLTLEGSAKLPPTK